jgi:hypothetical protein
MVKKVRHNGIHVATAENGNRNSPIPPFNALSRRFPITNDIGGASGGPSGAQLGAVSGALTLDCRITAAGYHYGVGESELWHFTLQDHYEPDPSDRRRKLR